MSREEAMLALIERGRLESEQTEAGRQARYKHEDEETARIRAHEDALQAEGAATREALKATLLKTITDRANTPQKQTTDKISELNARIAHLEDMIKASLAAPAATTPAPAAPPVTPTPAA